MSNNLNAIKTRAALYARVSTLLGQSTDNQLIPLREYVKNRGFVIANEYCDEGISGASSNRPALNALLADAKRKKFDVVIVAALDRFARSAKDLLIWIDELKAYDVNLISLRENIDLKGNPFGSAVAAFVGILAEIEKSAISDRIRIALQTKKLIAQQTGSGWRAGRKFIVNAEVVAEVKRLSHSGLSIRQIVKAMNGKIARSSVLRILHGYQGELTHRPVKNGDADSQLNQPVIKVEKVDKQDSKEGPTPDGLGSGDS